MRFTLLRCFFFFNDPPPTEISPLPLPDPLPILDVVSHRGDRQSALPVDIDDSAANIIRAVRSYTMTSPERLFALIQAVRYVSSASIPGRDRKSTRLNSSHLVISYAVFCLKKKKH